MRTFNANNGYSTQEQRELKKKHKQLRNLRKSNGNTAVYSHSGEPKEHFFVEDENYYAWSE